MLVPIRRRWLVPNRRTRQSRQRRFWCSRRACGSLYGIGSIDFAAPTVAELPPPCSARPFGAARFLPPPNSVLALRAARGMAGGRHCARVRVSAVPTSEVGVSSWRDQLRQYVEARARRNGTTPARAQRRSREHGFGGGRRGGPSVPRFRAFESRGGSVRTLRQRSSRCALCPAG